MAGYSQRPLVEKLGIKSGFKILLFNAPKDYDQILGKLPDGTVQAHLRKGPLDFIQFFTKEKSELDRNFPVLMKILDYKGMLWISWPKGSSKVNTDLTENVVREIGLKHGLVDVKVCAVDEIWSGLKFVYRLKDRPK